MPPSRKLTVLCDDIRQRADSRTEGINALASLAQRLSDNNGLIKDYHEVLVNRLRRARESHLAYSPQMNSTTVTDTHFAEELCREAPTLAAYTNKVSALLAAANRPTLYRDCVNGTTIGVVAPRSSSNSLTTRNAAMGTAPTALPVVSFAVGYVPTDPVTLVVDEVKAVPPVASKLSQQQTSMISNNKVMPDAPTAASHTKTFANNPTTIPTSTSFPQKSAVPNYTTPSFQGSQQQSGFVGSSAEKKDEEDPSMKFNMPPHSGAEDTSKKPGFQSTSGPFGASGSNYGTNGFSTKTEEGKKDTFNTKVGGFSGASQSGFRSDVKKEEDPSKKSDFQSKTGATSAGLFVASGGTDKAEESKKEPLGAGPTKPSGFGINPPTSGVADKTTTDFSKQPPSTFGSNKNPTSFGGPSTAPANLWGKTPPGVPDVKQTTMGKDNVDPKPTEDKPKDAAAKIQPEDNKTKSPAKSRDAAKEGGNSTVDTVVPEANKDSDSTQQKDATKAETGEVNEADKVAEKPTQVDAKKPEASSNAVEVPTKTSTDTEEKKTAATNEQEKAKAADTDITKKDVEEATEKRSDSKSANSTLQPPNTTSNPVAAAASAVPPTINISVTINQPTKGEAEIAATKGSGAKAETKEAPSIKTADTATDGGKAHESKSSGEVTNTEDKKPEETPAPSVTKSEFPAQAPLSVFGKAPSVAGFGPAAASAFGNKPAAFGQNAPSSNVFGALGKPVLPPADAATGAAASKVEAKEQSPEAAAPAAFGKAAVAPGFGQTAAAPFGSSKSPSPAPPAAEGDKQQTESAPKTEPTKSPSAGNPFGKPSAFGITPANTVGQKSETPNAISKPSSPSPAAGTEGTDASKEAATAKADDTKNVEGASTPTPPSSEASTPPPPDGTKETEPIKADKVDAAVAPNPNQAAKSAFPAAAPPASVFGGKSAATSAFAKALVASAFGSNAAFGNKPTTSAFGQTPTSAFPKPSSPPPPNPGAGKDGTVDEATQVPSAPISGAGYLQKDEATQMPSAPVSGVPQNDNLPLSVVSNAGPADGQTAPPASGFPSNTNTANPGFPNTSTANNASSAFNTNQVGQPNPTSVFGQASNNSASAFASAGNKGAFSQPANPFPNNTNSAFPPANQGGQPNGAGAFAQSNTNSAFSQANQGNNQPNAFAAALGGGNNSNGAGSGGSSGFAAAGSNPSVFGNNVGNKSAFSGSVGGAFAGASNGNNNNPSGGGNAFGNAQAQRTGFGSLGGASAFGKAANTQSAFVNQQQQQNNNFKSSF